MKFFVIWILLFMMDVFPHSGPPPSVKILENKSLKPQGGRLEKKIRVFRKTEPKNLNKNNVNFKSYTNFLEDFRENQKSCFFFRCGFNDFIFSIFVTQKRVLKKCRILKGFDRFRPDGSEVGKSRPSKHAHLLSEIMVFTIGCL